MTIERLSNDFSTPLRELYFDECMTRILGERVNAKIENKIEAKQIMKTTYDQKPKLILDHTIQNKMIHTM